MLNRLTLLLLLVLPSLNFAQGLNGGFEVVHAGGIPAGWSRILENSSSLTSDAFSGEKAAKAWVSEYYKSGGWVSTSKPPSAAGLPTGLTGVYKYEGRKKECDPGLVQVVATRRNADGSLDTLAKGETELVLSKQYRTFSLDVESVSGATNAEFLSVRIQTEGRCDWHIGDKCCYLFADDLAFNEQYASNIPAPDADALDAQVTPAPTLTEPVFIQPPRKKRKNRSFILRPAKTKVAKKDKPGAKGKKGRKAKKNTSPVPEPPTTIPPDVQKEIDRINAAQNDNTPDPAKAAEEKQPAEAVPPIIEDEFVPDENSFPEETEEGEGFIEEEDDGGAILDEDEDEE